MRWGISGGGISIHDREAVGGVKIFRIVSRMLVFGVREP